MSGRRQFLSKFFAIFFQLLIHDSDCSMQELISSVFVKKSICLLTHEQYIITWKLYIFIQYISHNYRFFFGPMQPARHKMERIAWQLSDYLDILNIHWKFCFSSIWAIERSGNIDMFKPLNVCRFACLQSFFATSNPSHDGRRYYS